MDSVIGGQTQLRSERRQRTALVAIRLTPTERDQITSAAAAAGVSVGKFIRDAALQRTRPKN